MTEQNKMDFVRARSKEQKDQRFQEIMRVTDTLFHASTFHAISLTTIAEALGWSRGNLYKYVTTKEEIFLALYIQKHHAWIDAVASLFSGVDRLSPEIFVRRWSRVLAENSDFLKYQNILAIVIETNVPIDALAAFKKNLWHERQPLVDVIRGQCPWMQDKEIRSFLLLQIYHACGLYNHIYLTPNLVEALNLAGIEVAAVDFATEFEHFLHTYMTGMMAV